MNFFEHQDQARSRTTLLVVLFVLAVSGLVGAAGTVAFVALGAQGVDGEAPPDRAALVALAMASTLGIIFLGSLYRMFQLRAGGSAVAETLGGRLIAPDSQEPLERRCLNVVEEMAIASGTPVPPLYLMDREAGLNAFAAGWSSDDAVIGVTRGLLEALSREQLQGVIAHEFSHILNRDCALNLRLLGVLHGIIVISLIGRLILRAATTGRSSSSKSNPLPILAVGAGVWIFGSLGALLARLIQAAVSRQREFLADASAVQYTRNPDGIAGALATLGLRTSSLGTARGQEASHMLFGEPGRMKWLNLTASHPPLDERIARILPSWDGDFESLAQARPPQTVELQSRTSQRQDAELGDPFDAGELGAFAQVGAALAAGGQTPPAGRLTGSTPSKKTQAASTGSAAATPRSSHVGGAPNSFDRARALLGSIPPHLKDAAESPFSARALLLAWLIDGDPGHMSAQLALVSSDGPLLAETERLSTALRTLPEDLRLPLFDIALGTLAALSGPQKAAFLDRVEHLSAQLSPRGYQAYCLSALTRRHLGQKPKVTEPLLIKDAIEVVLSVLAHQGHSSDQDALAAFQAGCDQLGKRGRSLALWDGDDHDIGQLHAALSTLMRLPLPTRVEILRAAETIAAHDGVLRPSEKELVRTLATCLGVGFGIEG